MIAYNLHIVFFDGGALILFHSCRNISDEFSKMFDFTYKIVKFSCYCQFIFCNFYLSIRAVQQYYGSIIFAYFNNSLL